MWHGCPDTPVEARWTPIGSIPPAIIWIKDVNNDLMRHWYQQEHAVVHQQKCYLIKLNLVLMMSLGISDILSNGFKSERINTTGVWT